MASNDKDLKKRIRKVPGVPGRNNGVCYLDRKGNK